ncbi:hypothetical protein PNIG_p0004 (plasmid) [Pseudoalteromonas nigrifaciens]|uniref:Transposase n=1 Tax=Pseudoalteromonas nigrifaciens TaxID=28109 RepID=A0AAC9UNJ2_9GAMM|nr:transposase [Pseudoalteromonas nigrifaciens]ASM56289.1 hypothetical protein PNIG_p0004 [Pseudoalteromonas nigrifaciens]GEN44154.1 hypothetical protein PNI02_36200 [Pseudoalteromonas nigrifaciens]SUD25056.1 Uncharacterised protein [Pseudoalteromonas nigrifaciens]
MKKQQKIKYWQAIIEQQQSSALTTIQFCRDNNINPSTFYAWRKRLFGENTAG